MPLFTSPGFVSSLKEARYWSLDWCQEQQIQGQFNYVVLLKADGGYRVFGQFSTATEAFDARRQLVADTGVRGYFLRAVRVTPVEETIVIGPGYPESREDLDRWRDALSTGDETLIPSEEIGSFRQWAASAIENRPEYRRSASRGARLHGEIPF